MVEDEVTRGTKRTRQDVAEAALHILDEQGLPDLTMRRIAESLGMRPSALYWHFPNKQALLAAVSGRILAPCDAPLEPGLAWDEAMTCAGRRLRDSLLTYRDGAELVSSSLALGLIESPAHDLLVAAARHGGVDEELAHVAADTVSHYVVGHVFHEQQRQQADSLGLLAPDNALTPHGATVRTAQHPFEAGLALIVGGVSAHTGSNLT